MTLPRLLILALLTVAPPTVLAQSVTNDTDVDLFNSLEVMAAQGDALDLVGPLDMESDPKGKIVLAYAVHSDYLFCGYVRVVYGTRDAMTGVTSWRALADLGLSCGPTDPTRVKAVSVAAMNGRAFVAVVFEARGSDVLALYDGGVQAPWRFRPDNIAIINSQRARPIQDDLFMGPSIGIVPHARGDFKRFSVGIAYVAEGARGGPEIEMLWNDYTQPRTSWFAQKIAGAPGTLIQGSFTRPSFTADDRGPSWGIAFEEVAVKRVRVFAGDVTAAPQNIRSMYVSNPESQRHHPTLRAHEGTAVLTALGTPLDNGIFSLEWSTGDFFDPMTWRNQPQITNRCRTPADLDIKRGIATVVATCFDGSASPAAFRVGAFELDRQRMTASRFVPIDDVTGAGRQPRVAVGPPGQQTFSAVAYATEMRFPLPDTVHGHKVMMFDP